MDYKYLIRWTDDKGVARSKAYQTEDEARKAEAWLIQRGVEDVDMAYSIIVREETPDADYSTPNNNK